LGILSLSLAYLPVLYFTLKKNKLLKRKRHLTIVGIITAFFFSVNLLFLLMHWPLREYTQYISWIFIFIFLIMLFSSIIKSDDDNRILYLSLMLFFFILFIINITLYIKNLNNPKMSLYTIENNLEESIRLFEYRTDEIYRSLDSIRNYPRKKDLADIKENTDKIIIHIERTRKALFINKKEQEKFHEKLIKDYINIDKLEADAIKLEKEISRYRDFMLDKAASFPHLKTFLEQGIQFEKYDLNNYPPILYNNLNKLIRDIKIAEYEMLNKITLKKAFIP
jgi:hypothetical protein